MVNFFNVNVVCVDMSTVCGGFSSSFRFFAFLLCTQRQLWPKAPVQHVLPLGHKRWVGGVGSADTQVCE